MMDNIPWLSLVNFVMILMMTRICDYQNKAIQKLEEQIKQGG